MRFASKVARTPDSRRNWPSVVSTYAAVCLFLFINPALFGAAPDAGPHSAFIRTGQFPGVRFNSGLTVCDEELRNGRWVSRYWDSSGQIIADIQIDGERQQMDMLPVDAFKLVMEGQELSGTWKWVGASKSEVKNPDGLLVTVELESSIRPVRVKIHTLLSGSPVMVRWLEVTNIGQRPTAISNVSPWSGQLWHTPNFAEKLPPNSENVYDVGYAQYDQWGYEGAWRFYPVYQRDEDYLGRTRQIGLGAPNFLCAQQCHGGMVCCFPGLERELDNPGNEQGGKVSRSS